jgi:hypothetical protein
VLVVGEVVRMREKLNWYERSRDGEPAPGAATEGEP